jgi:hypothetical protein
MDTMYCEFCGTIRSENELFKEDVCASGQNGQTCCYAYKCKFYEGIECHFECVQCHKKLRIDTAIVTNNDVTYRRTCMCNNCYISIPENRCICGSQQEWKIIKDGKLQCNECNVIKKIKKVKIWYGISIKKYDERYN